MGTPVIQPRETFVVHDARGFVRHVMQFKLARKTYLKLLAISALIEGSYALRLYIIGGLATAVGARAVQGIYQLSRDQALVTALVPVLLGYITVKILADLTPDPAEPLGRYRGWLLTPISVFVMIGLGCFFFAIGVLGSMPVYRIVRVTWITPKAIGFAFVAAFAIGLVFSVIAGALLDLVTRYCQRAGKADSLRL